MNMMMIPEADMGAISPQTSKQYQHLQQFWFEIAAETKNETNFKSYQLPLARIKKIMKADKDVKMISQEAPILFAKACEIFIRELTLRAWLQTEENKRKTLQRNDIAAAISKTDMYDFLIDIVPREDIKLSKKIEEAQRAPELQQYFYQLQQQVPDRPMDMMYFQQLQQQQYQNYLTQQRLVAYHHPDHLEDHDIHPGYH
mmetsp:Transcript_632/g.950  ORF Transcript_632/g.950 Transcript_632/m.950 type:complete len:200 (-) Transcript_632:15-614(-)